MNPVFSSTRKKKKEKRRPNDSERILNPGNEICTVVPISQNTNKFPATSPSSATVQSKNILFGEALLFDGKPVLVLPTLEEILGADVVDDDPVCVGVPGSVVVVGVLRGVPALVLIVTDGTPATVEHMSSKTRNEKCMNNP